MINVCGDDRAAARDFGADELGSDGISNCRLPIADWFGAGMTEVQIVARDIPSRSARRRTVRARPRAPQNFAAEILANRDEFHLGSDDALASVPQLRDAA